MLECVSVHIIIYPKYNCAFAGRASLFAMQLSLIRNIGICFPPLLIYFGLVKKEKRTCFSKLCCEPIKVRTQKNPKKYRISDSKSSFITLTKPIF
jgi:hypothetical protein